jgi:hypothetical protein
MSLLFAAASIVSALTGNLPLYAPLLLAFASALAMIDKRITVMSILAIAACYRTGGAPVNLAGFTLSQRDCLLLLVILTCTTLPAVRTAKPLLLVGLAAVGIIATISSLDNSFSLTRSAPDFRLAIPIIAGLFVARSFTNEQLKKTTFWLLIAQATAAIVGAAIAALTAGLVIDSPFILIDGSIPLSRVSLDWAFGIVIAMSVAGRAFNLSWASLLLLGGGLVASGTFSLIGATIIAIVAGWIFSQTRGGSGGRPAKILRLVAISAIAAILLFTFLPGLSQRFSLTRVDSATIVYRQQEFSAADKVVGPNGLIGAGVGSQIRFVDPSNRVVQKNDVHNSYLMVYLKAGWIGLSLYLLVLAGLITNNRAWQPRAVVLVFMAVVSWTVPILSTPLGLFVIGYLCINDSFKRQVREPTGASDSAQQHLAPTRVASLNQWQARKIDGFN